jgi:hypothetical protein
MSLETTSGSAPGSSTPSSGFASAVSQQRLLERVQRSLIDGHPIHLPDREYRFMRRGQHITEGNDLLEALDSGIYGRMEVQHGRSPDVSYTWGYFVNLGDARDFFSRLIAKLSQTDCDATLVRLAANAALGQMRPDRNLAADQRPQIDMESTADTDTDDGTAARPAMR